MKTLQKRLQPLLIEVIDSDQIVFLPHEFILDNIMNKFNVPRSRAEILSSLKLDFSKVYDSVGCKFMFQVMKNLGMPNSFVHMVRLLFQDVVVYVNVNSQASDPCELHRGVCHGCPRAPYMFIIIAKAMNATIQNAVRIGLITSTILP